MTQLPTSALQVQNGYLSPVEAQSNGRWWMSVDHCVHVIDDDARFLEVIGNSLQSFELNVERYPCPERYLSTRALRDVDCLLLDMRMPGMNGVELLKALKAYHFHMPVLMLSAYQDTSGVVSAMQNGAVDYLVKPIDEQELLTKVSSALHKNWSEKQRSADVQHRLHSLSDREREVMELFVAAKTTRQVAHALGISPKTVEKHRLNIFDKLNVDSVPAMIRLLFDLKG